MKKILIISNSIDNLLDIRKELIDNLINRNYKVYLIGSIDSRKNNSQTYKKYNLININFSSSYLNIYLNIYIFIKLFFIIKKLNPNYTLVFNLRPIIFSGLSSKILNIKSIFTITGLGSMYIYFSKSKLKFFILKFFYKFIFKVLCNHKSFKIFQNSDDYNYFINNNISTLKNSFLVKGSGVNLSKFKYLRYPLEKTITFAYIGRLIKHKGIEEFIKASEKLSNENLNFQSVIVGDFDQKNLSSFTKKNFRKRIEANNSIKYLNYTNNIKDLILNIHCIVLPSYREGMSNILMQSISMGRPIITTNEPGCRELVIDKSNGFIINSRSVRDLLLAMKTFINLGLEEKINMSKKSREHSINFDIQNVVNLYNNLLSDI